MTFQKTPLAQQLKFLNSHCSIVCSYCFVVCLVAKNELKMIKFSSSFKLNEIHILDSPFSEDPKNIFCFPGRGTAGNLVKMDNNRDIYCYANRDGQFSKEDYQPIPLVPKSL